MLAGTLLAAALVLAIADPAWAEPALRAAIPASLHDGLMAGLRQPVVVLNQLAAVIAVGCLATMHRGAFLPIAYVLATVIGASAHIGERTVTDADVFAALMPVALGLMIFRKKPLRRDVVFALFAGAGLIDGYVMGAVVAAAQRDAIVGYLAGLAAIGIAIALAVMFGVKLLAGRDQLQLLVVRVIGAFAVGAGAAVLLQRYAG